MIERISALSKRIGTVFRVPPIWFFLRISIKISLKIFEEVPHRKDFQTGIHTLSSALPIGIPKIENRRILEKRNRTDFEHLIQHGCSQEEVGYSFAFGQSDDSIQLPNDFRT